MGRVAAMTPLKLLIFVLSSISLAAAQSCDDFTEGLCPLSEDNIIGSTTASDAESCQTACRNNTECNFFSFIGSQCCLLYRSVRLQPPWAQQQCLQQQPPWARQQPLRA